MYHSIIKPYGYYSMAFFDTADLIDAVRHEFGIDDESGLCAKILPRPSRCVIFDLGEIWSQLENCFTISLVRRHCGVRGEIWSQFYNLCSIKFDNIMLGGNSVRTMVETKKRAVLAQDHISNEIWRNFRRPK